ncbi:MFS transporter [Streptomyces sp. NPDC002680]|uniref:MFS transporter n=1 Tax=Streptomyces sp. NPDC002680 TaxID=3364659 RepID=UPI00367C9CBD
MFVAPVAGTDTAYPFLVGPMIVAGIGMGFVFAPTAAVVLGSVSREHAGKASGANTIVREIGWALGIAVLSTVFVAHGSTDSPQRFVDGLHPAVWAGVVVVFAGAVCALGLPRRPRPEAAEEAQVPAGAVAERVSAPRPLPRAGDCPYVTDRRSPAPTVRRAPLHPSFRRPRRPLRSS